MPRDAAMIEALASDLRNKITYARGITSDHRQYEELRDGIRLNIEHFQKQLDRLEDIHLNGLRYVDEWKEQLLALNAEKKLHTNAEEIEKLIKTQEKINAITSAQGNGSVERGSSSQGF